MIQFFAPDIETSLTLPESDSAHATRVLRLKEGDKIHVTDGKGTRFLCAITDAHHKHTQVEILEKEYIPRHWGAEINIAIAPTKNMDRMEWFVEKATELGVDRIIPLKCTHSERKVLKTERLEKIVTSAMKQSLKTWIPEICELTDLKDLLATDFNGQKFIAWCDKDSLRHSYAKFYDPDKPMLMLIGPEGDFSIQEAEAACKTGFLPVTFGDSRLRTETAALFAVAAAHTIKNLNQK